MMQDTGFWLMVFGICVTGITMGFMYGIKIGWLTIGSGAILLGLFVFILGYLGEKRG